MMTNTNNTTYRHDNTYSKDLLEAALHCGIPLEDIELALAGYATSDEEFASKKNICGNVRSHYVERNGYYFSINY